MTLHDELAPIRSELTLLGNVLKDFAPTRAEQAFTLERRLWNIGERARLDALDLLRTDPTTPPKGGFGEDAERVRGAEPRPESVLHIGDAMPKSGNWCVRVARWCPEEGATMYGWVDHVRFP